MPVRAPYVAPKASLLLTYRARRALISHQRAVDRAAPKRSQENGGLAAAWGEAEDRRDRGDDEGDADGPAQDLPDGVDRAAPGVVAADGVAEVAAGDEHEEAGESGDAGADGEEDGAAVLDVGGTVAFDAVDAVGAAFDLGHRGGEGDHAGEEAGAQGELADVLGAFGVGEQVVDELVAGARGEGEDRVGDDLAALGDAELADEAGERDEERHDREAQLQAEGARVAEAVAVPEAQEGVPHQAPAAVAAQCVPGVVGGEVVAGHQACLGDLPGAAHSA